MILWTIQYECRWEELQRIGRLRASWRHVQSNWREAYLWMARQMVTRGLCSRPIAPIWAWHSCGSLQRAPDEETAGSSFCWFGEVIVSIKIDVPDALVLLSEYGAWNRILDECGDAHSGDGKLDPLGNDWERAFRVNLEPRAPWGDDNNHDIQACLPYAELSWVRGYEKLRMPNVDDLKDG